MLTFPVWALGDFLGIPGPSPGEAPGFFRLVTFPIESSGGPYPWGFPGVICDDVPGILVAA